MSERADVVTSAGSYRWTLVEQSDHWARCAPGTVSISVCLSSVSPAASCRNQPI